MSDKKIIRLIIIGLAVIVLIVIGILVVRHRQNNPAGPGQIENTPAPEYLNAEEKTALVEQGKIDVSPETPVQIISRDSNGEPLVFKIINSESDIVADPANMPPVSPRSLKTE